MKSKLLIIILLSLTVIIPVLAQQSQKRITDDVEIQKLSDNVYLHRSYFQTKNFGKVAANGLIIIKDGKALMIDTPWNNEQTKELFKWVNDSLNATVNTFIATHWHDDCIGGLEFLETKGVKSYANQMTIDIAKEKRLPLPQQGFSDSLKIEFSNIPIECFYLGGGHSSDNIVVWLPTEDMLFAGCCIKDMSSTNLGNLSDADVKTWPTTIQKIMKKFSKVKTVVPGHGSIGGCELMEHTIELLEK